MKKEIGAEKTMVYEFGYRDTCPTSLRKIPEVGGIVGHVYAENDIVAYDSIGKQFDIQTKTAYYFFWVRVVDKRSGLNGSVVIF